MVVLLLFMVPEGFFLVSVAANYSGDGRSLYCTKVGSRRQKRFRSLYFRAQSVTSVTETIAVRKYSMQWRVFPIRRGSCHCSPTPTKNETAPGGHIRHRRS